MKKTFSIITVLLLGTANMAAGETELPEAFMVGSYEVYILNENTGSADTGIFVDAPASILEEYAPDGTVPNALNAVLIKKGSKIWLVDTGFGRHIFDAMASLGVTPQDVDYVLLTHMHGDHTGGMLRGDLKVSPNAEVIVSVKEHCYWSSDEQMNMVPEDRRGNFISAQKIFAEYGDKLRTVEPFDIGDGLEDGIIPIAAYGHTPGHVMFMVKDKESRLLIWGDLVHAMAVQMPHPEISVTYDVDPDAARKSRMEILRYISNGGDAKLKTPVIGMHVPALYPGIVCPDGENGYRFEELTPPY